MSWSTRVAWLIAYTYQSLKPSLIQNSGLRPEIDRLKGSFGLEQRVIVGDRARISYKAIEQPREEEGVGGITALKRASIRALLKEDPLQRNLFDECDLFELSAPTLPVSACSLQLKSAWRRCAWRSPPVA